MKLRNKLTAADVRKHLKTATIECCYMGNPNHNKQLLYRKSTFIVVHMIGGKINTKATFRKLEKAVERFNQIYLFN